jgi:capsular exopolysaccharide synthesis family protein
MVKDLDNRVAPSWLRPAAEQGGLTYYVQVIRERIWIVVTILLVTLAGAGAYLVMADDVYEGEARLLITPQPADDALAASLGLPLATNDPTRDVETAATQATSLDVAERAREELGLTATARSLQRRVSAEPIASSNLVSLTAEGPTAVEAADLANAFAAGFLDERTADLHREVDELLPAYQDQLQAGSDAAATPDASLQTDVARLQAFRAGQDPTVGIEEEAVPATSPVAPRPTLTIVGALIAGLVLGVAGAFAAQTLDPRLRREEQLRSRYNLPILARVPRDTGRKGRPLGPGLLSLPAKEAYRTLRANITAARQSSQAPHAVLVTGSSPSEGKTTTAINLAGSLALAGNRVILIEADLRRPAIGSALGISVDKGVVSTLLENTTLEEALVTTESFGPSLELLLADYKGGWMSELFSLHAAQRLLATAKARADFVIIDSPPLTTVVDTLPLARQADDVLIVTRLGTTRIDKLPELAELLASNGITPLGIALIGTDRRESGYYYQDSEDTERPAVFPGGPDVREREEQGADEAPADVEDEAPADSEDKPEAERSAQPARWSRRRSEPA